LIATSSAGKNFDTLSASFRNVQAIKQTLPQPRLIATEPFAQVQRSVGKILPTAAFSRNQQFFALDDCEL